MSSTYKHPYEKTLREYLNLNQDESLLKRDFIPDQSYGMSDLHRGCVPGVDLTGDLKLMGPRPTQPLGIEFRKCENTGVGVAMDMASNSPVGFISFNQPLSIKRNIGIGSHLVAYFDGDYPPGSRSYSESGWRTRIASHALIVFWALLDGKIVPALVQEEYCKIENGRFENREKIRDLQKLCA